MSFYDSISKQYDEMTGGDIRYLRQKEILARFLKKHPMQTALDVACGSGVQTLALAELGVRTTGVDLSSGLLNIAEQRAVKLGVDVRLIRGDMLHLSSIVDVAFDGVFCMGNSIPHLTGDDDLRNVLAQFHSVLNRKGTLLIQLLNYERILNEHKRVNQITRSGKHEFIRFYDYLDRSLLRFNVLMINWETGTPEHSINSIELRAYSADELNDELRNAGFTHIETYEEPDFTPFYADRSPTVTLIARKPD